MRCPRPWRARWPPPILRGPSTRKSPSAPAWVTPTPPPWPDSPTRRNSTAPCKPAKTTFYSTMCSPAAAQSTHSAPTSRPAEAVSSRSTRSPPAATRKPAPAKTSHPGPTWCKNLTPSLARSRLIACCRSRILRNLPMHSPTAKPATSSLLPPLTAQELHSLRQEYREIDQRLSEIAAMTPAQQAELKQRIQQPSFTPRDLTPQELDSMQQKIETSHVYYQQELARLRPRPAQA